jgi:hypothetical protein
MNILGKDARAKGKYLQKDEKDLEVSIHWQISSNIYLDDGQFSSSVCYVYYLIHSHWQKSHNLKTEKTVNPTISWGDSPGQTRIFEGWMVRRISLFRLRHVWHNIMTTWSHDVDDKRLYSPATSSFVIKKKKTRYGGKNIMIFTSKYMMDRWREKLDNVSDCYQTLWECLFIKW